MLLTIGYGQVEKSSWLVSGEYGKDIPILSGYGSWSRSAPGASDYRIGAMKATDRRSRLDG